MWSGSPVSIIQVAGAIKPVPIPRKKRFGSGSSVVSEEIDWWLVYLAGATIR